MEGSADPSTMFEVPGRANTERGLAGCPRHVARLAESGINAVAGSAVAAGKGGYAMILWVNPKDYARAARALKAR